ncbi:Acetylpolyamine aminohydrolase [Neolecta irregularis DAH-3]|uniref:Acetylpolyamine aminohydrolase n=1 Tax=Neolecta irregularis (strain DAH-3) TaxID=1198029 RepID=A0A1U7LRC5_NEOID|nr:Acetylpolyamine aminohydrolase [Neolecta irregularis DAH-3]|eukprot:OLL25215.1 Acetylpolyamine aminohydrolase [Neolecta irregularis DAH-3]
MRVFTSLDCLLHNPPFEILDGDKSEWLESPARIEKIKQVLIKSERFKFEQFIRKNTLLISKLYTTDGTQFEKKVDIRVSEGRSSSGVIPETFLHFNLVDSDDFSTHSVAQVGRFAFDMTSTITKDTWKSAYAAVQCVLSGANAIMNGGKTAYALVRPPGHHSTQDLCGGYCYLNHAAIAANYLSGRKVILDVDYHHGNGTEKIVKGNEDILYVSLHADDDYPYYTGHRNAGNAINIPLPRTTTTDEYILALQKAISHHILPFRPDFLIISFGVDTYNEDPIAGFSNVDRGMYTQMGRQISQSKCPSLWIQEGGYHMETLGDIVKDVLSSYMDVLEI